MPGTMGWVGEEPGATPRKPPVFWPNRCSSVTLAGPGRSGHQASLREVTRALRWRVGTANRRRLSLRGRPRWRSVSMSSKASAGGGRLPTKSPVRRNVPRLLEERIAGSEGSRALERLQHRAFVDTGTVLDIARARAATVWPESRWSSGPRMTELDLGSRRRHGAGRRGGVEDGEP